MLLLQPINITDDMITRQMKQDERERYVSPSLNVLELFPEGILCESVTEDNEYVDGEW